MWFVHFAVKSSADDKVAFVRLASCVLRDSCTGDGRVIYGDTEYVLALQCVISVATVALEAVSSHWHLAVPSSLPKVRCAACSPVLVLRFQVRAVVFTGNTHSPPFKHTGAVLQRHGQ